MIIYNIPIKAIPKQTFTTNINNKDLTINIQYNQIMMFSVSIDNKYICQNERVFANQPIMPYPWQVKQLGGNFIFKTDNDNYPIYKNFNNGCNLHFLTSD